jgi:hypothetical protein
LEVARGETYGDLRVSFSGFDPQGGTDSADFSGDAAAAPPPGKAGLILIDPRGGAALDAPAELGEYGTASLEWRAPEDAPYGDRKAIDDFNPDEGRDALWLSRPRR